MDMEILTLSQYFHTSNQSNFAIEIPNGLAKQSSKKL